MLQISFGHSKSKNFSKALEIANNIGGVMDKGIMTITLHDYELLSAHEALSPLIQIIANWKNVKATYKNREVDLYKFVFQVWRNVVDCSQERNQTWNTRHCWNNIDQEGWGCKQLNPFSRHLYGNGEYKRSNRFWYNFGNFVKPSLWKINKRLIFETLMKEAEQLNLILCPFFEKEKIRQQVNLLPDSIVVDNLNYKIYYNDIGESVNIRHIPPETIEKKLDVLSSIPLYCSN